MKTAYKVFLIALSILILSWFLPWLYSIVFPAGVSDPFVAYSPVTDSFIISESGGGDIYAVDADGKRMAPDYTKEERDSLLPHIYYTQLVAQERLPDSIDGKAVSIPEFKHSQWVFSSSPRDLIKVPAKVYMMMESMPARIDLEDPDEVFRLNGQVEFIDIRTNTVNPGRSRRFTDIFGQRGFEYPVKALHANVTTRKPYDEGYLMADNKGDIFHVKMQAGRPYMVRVNKPDSVIAEHLFILENVDTRPLGLVTDADHNLYVLEHEGYRLIPLPVGKVNPETDRISIVKNLFNWVVKIGTSDSSRWVALDSDDYSRLASYAVKYPETTAGIIAGYI
ncbi:MAG: DUF4857 domain-containing protein, partial [Duncaniella sp.]|nr:DUF4857 domain-containing protein [Duncaniella sp.]